MPPLKRKRNAATPLKGLLPGEKLKRNAIPGASVSSPWGWVGTEVVNVAQITLEHRLVACNLSPRNKNAYCSNRFSIPSSEKEPSPKPLPPSSSTINGELDDDVIIISDDEDESPSCSKKECKGNPNCLNYLGQELWEDEDDAQSKFMKAANIGGDPSEDNREADLPVGLKNLGATCYANASLQVWYRDMAFRAGVFSCEPPEGVSEEKYKDSPIFQLQVTFAALQEGNKMSFNPEKLVESLQLRATEQQDAQEFSKLFMSHLDAEFKKQSSPVKSLVTDQFQGSQVYGTICHACKNRSERASDFLEIEINFDSNSTLEDRLAASLLPEKLTGDNKYFCSRCEALQDATRYTELRQLPPVLHFSLLRFVYDISTMERKKSKYSISFPKELDMGKYLGSKNARENNKSSTRDAENLYELRGVLLHKGASAYHGHYEAQVYDAECESWFQFNDETVTKIASLGDKISGKANGKATTEKQDMAQARKNRINNARKRKRIEDSDDEIVEVNPKESPTPSPATSPPKPSLISSKDAYMLIYARKSQPRSHSQQEIDSSSQSNNPLAPKPPARAMSIIQDFNTKHDIACQEFKERANELTNRFKDLRQKVKEIYQHWGSRNYDDDAIVSRQAMENWLSDRCIEAALKGNGAESDNEKTEVSDSVEQAPSLPLSIPIPEVLCEHGSLDPLKAKEMKRISRATLDSIVETTRCTFDPILQPSDACAICVSSLFQEKLYDIEHSRYVKQFDELSPINDDDEIGYWIPKKWCKDWRLMKPKMHEEGQEDPAPDSEEFYSHVYCEHGGLSLNVTNRRKISAASVELLQTLFPTWNPPSSDSEACAVCEADVHISKEDRKEVRRRAEEEKCRLKFIYQSSLDVWTNAAELLPCAIIPSQFIKTWRRWVNNPSDNARPEEVDNTPFFCTHDHLLFDPNRVNDLDSTILIIERDQWDQIQTIYPGGPLISLTKMNKQDGQARYEHEIPVCEECRAKKKTEWQTADIFIRIGGPEGTEAVTESKQNQPAKSVRANSSRQSKRLRQIKEHGERRRINVSKSTTVKDLKVMANAEFSIPTICQRLYYQGRELLDNSETVADLQLSVNDIIDLREETEIVTIDSDSDEPPAKKKRREGPAFGGTLLGYSESPWSSSPERTPIPSTSGTQMDEEKPCLACTYSNLSQALICEMCETPF